MRPSPFHRAVLIFLCLLALAAPRVIAGGGPTGVVVVYNPNDPRSVTIANEYQQVRGVPERNMVPYAFPTTTTFTRTTAWDFVYSLRATLKARGLEPQLQCFALAGVTPLSSRTTSPSIDELSLHSFLYASPNFSEASSPWSSGYVSNKAYVNPADITGPAPNGTAAMTATTTYEGMRYWPVSSIGFPGNGGNSLKEILGFIARAKARDGLKPTGGTIYWPLNSDIRSQTRAGQINVVKDIWQQRGIRFIAEREKFWVSDRLDIQGGIAGATNPPDIGGNTYMPGAWVDHLTSYGGNLQALDGQMTCSRWLRRGADGSSGTMSEPYAIAEKFTHANIHTHLRAGASQVEAFWQSISWPSEIICLGDPLLQTFADFPNVTISAPAEGATVSGNVLIAATAAPTGGKTLESNLDLFIDGRRIAIGQAGETVAVTRTVGGFSVNTATLGDGWHEVRVVAYNNDSVRTQNEAVRTIQVNNAGQSIVLNGPATVNPDGNATFTVTPVGLGDLTSLTLQANGRTLATLPTSGGSANISGSLAPLANKWSVYAVGTRSNGQQVWSAPFTTMVDWPAQPAATNVALGGAQANVRYFNSTNGTGFNWDTSTPDVTTTFTGNDTTGGLSLTQTNIPGITFNSTTVESLKPGYEVKCWFYAPTDDFYEVAVLSAAWSNSATASVAINGTTLPENGSRRLSPGWHELRLRLVLTVNNWSNSQVRLRGGASQDFSLIIPSVSASMGSGSNGTTPTINSVAQSASPVTTANVTLTANATGGGGNLTYHWSLLSAPPAVQARLGSYTEALNFSSTGTSQPSTTVTFTQTGNYVIGLRVAGATDSAFTTVPVSVQAAAPSMTLSTNGYTSNGYSYWLHGLPLNVYAYSKDQFGRRIDITPTVAGNRTVNWTTTDPSGSFQNISATGENAQFVTANASCYITATGTNGRTGSATLYITAATNLSPNAYGSAPFTIMKPGTSNALVFTALSSIDPESFLLDPYFRSPYYPAVLSSYQWSVVSTPPGGTLALSGNNTQTITGVPSAPGAYTLRLTVTDQAGATVSQTMGFYVNADGSTPSPFRFRDKNLKVGETVFVSRNVLKGSGETYQMQTSADGGTTWQSCNSTVQSHADIDDDYVLDPDYDQFIMRYEPVTMADNNRLFRIDFTKGGVTTIGVAGKITVLDTIANRIRIKEVMSLGGKNVTYIPEDAGSMTFTLTRTAGSSGAASADWVAYYDTSELTGTATWADGDNSDRPITIPIVNDNIPIDQYISFEVVDTTGATIWSASYLEVIIVDDDNAGKAAFLSSAASVSESAGSVSLPVRRSGPFKGPLTINYSTEAISAVAGQDFTAVNGTLTWADGDTTDKQIIVPILSDDLVEGEEQFKVSLTEPDGTTPTTLGSMTVCTVTVTAAPYQQWQKAWWPSWVPTMALYSDYAAALGSYSPMVRFPLNETSGQTVAISAATSGASIRYTTDGSTPTSTSGTLYTSPLTISATTTLKAIAYKSGMDDSAVSTGVYTISEGTISDSAGGNIALNKPASASSSYNTGLGSNFGNDGVTSNGNGWSSASATVADWWQVDLGSAFNINRVELVSRQNADQPETRRNYEVRASNNADMSNYVVLATTGSTAFAHQGTWSAAVSNSGSYRYLRVAKTIPEYSFFAEFRAYAVETVTAPTFSTSSGTYASAQSVTISSTTSGATIRYTTDGSTPSATVGTVYTSPVNIASTATLKAIAYKSGMNDSAVTTGDYTIGGSNALAAPTFSPAAGTYLSTQTVAGVDATGTTVANGTLTKIGTGNYTLGVAGPRPLLWPGLPSTNTAVSFTTGNSVTGTPPYFITNGASLNCGTANGLGSKLGSGFTVSMFIKTSITDREMIIAGGKRAGTNPNTFFVSLNRLHGTTSTATPHAVRIYIAPQEANAAFDYSVVFENTPTGSICDGQWHHLAITVPPFSDPSYLNLNSPRFYFDGVEVNALDVRGNESIGSSATFSDFSDTGFRLGADGSATPIKFFNGALDEFCFFSRELSATEIADLCTAQPPTTPPTYMAETANPTGDGVPNIMKYALGLSPLTKASREDLPSIQPKTNNTVDFNFTRMRDATDIIYQVERRWDLMSGSWTEVYSSIGDPFGSTDPSMTESLNFDLQGNPKAFFRLKITRP